jgi:hypothetical protein
MADCKEPSAWGDVVTWLLVIVGWLVVNWQSNLRETRKEIRERIDCLRDDILKLEDLSTRHHTVDNDPVRRAEIKRLIAAVAASAKMIGDAGLSIEKRSQLIRDLRQAITLRNFDEEYAPVPVTDPIVIDIGASVAALLRATETAYSQRYHKPIRTRLGLT